MVKEDKQASPFLPPSFPSPAGEARCPLAGPWELKEKSKVKKVEHGGVLFYSFSFFFSSHQFDESTRSFFDR